MRTRVVLTLLAGSLALSSALAQSIEPADLQHHRWVLEAIDAEPLPEAEGGKIPELDFGEQMTVSGNLGCNNFTGKAVLRDGFFLIESLASTRMMCPPPWSDIELRIMTVLGSESTPTISEAGFLTLESADTVLLFRPADWVAAAAGVPVGVQANEAPEFRKSGSRFGFAQNPPPFGGPTSPAGEIYEADEELDPAFRFPKIDSAFEPWAQWKSRQNSEHGLALSAHYSTMYQQASDVIGDRDKATAGVLRATALWTLVGRDTPNFGRLNVMLDHRHGYRAETPANLAGQFGYIGQTGVFYNDIGFAVINLNWQQSLKDGDAGLIVGRYDPNDYMNVLGYVNPWSIFSNLAVNLDTSVALPDSSWGIGAGTFITDQFYVIGGINDANGLGSDDLEFFDGGAEFFKYMHVGWTPSKDERYFKNFHVLAWHVDEREDLGIDSAHGLAIAANWTWDERWMVFGRLGFSNGSSPIYNESVTAGLIRKFLYRSDLVGFAVNHGSPPDSSLSDQTSIEAFWRFQFSQNLAITPSVQLIMDPALNPVDDEVWVWGLRMRLTL